MRFSSEAAKLSGIRKTLESAYPLEKTWGKKRSEAIRELENLVFSLHSFGDIDIRDVFSRSDIKFFQNAFCDYETSLEERRALEAINGERNVFTDRVLSRTFDYSIEEGKMAGIGKNDKVLVIGSGPFPETAMSYAKSFGCAVRCIERERRFSRISTELVESMGLSEMIEVINADGKNADVTGFDKILVTILTKDKPVVLDNARSSGAQVIARTAFGSSCLIYEPIAKAQLERFVSIGRLIRWGKNFTSSLLLENR